MMCKACSVILPGRERELERDITAEMQFVLSPHLSEILE